MKKLKNVSIVVTDKRTVTVVTAAGKSGGPSVLFEGKTFRECCDYIRKEYGKNHFQLDSSSCIKKFTDAEGCTMPWIMDVRM